ncbi:MAG: OpgC domain-containing protein, partial [Chloroflexota bacterium]|nr:OpgC domain-containing protein [Chloroflexota bacterium]
VAMAIGYHRDALTRKLSQRPRLPYFLFVGALLVWLMQLNATQGALLARLVPGLNTYAVMSDLFLKNSLAAGRLVASAIVFQFAFLAATLLWKPIATVLGWLLLPLGQNALYTYTMHVAIIGLFYAALPYLPGHITTSGTINTSLQLLVILAIWAMVQRQFLFRIIPR